MRGLGWVWVAVLGGCTGLNGAFDESEGAATGGGSTVGETVAVTTGGMKTSGSTSGVTSVSDSSTGPPTVSSGSESSSMSTTDGPPVTSSESTQGQSGDTGPDSSTGEGVPVLFLYAADGWMGPGNTTSETTANDHCLAFAPAAARRCDSTAIAVLRQPDLNFVTILNSVDLLLPGAEVFGLGSDGSTRLAGSAIELLGELQTTLSAGGVIDPSGTGMFYSGGTGDTTNTCAGWQETDNPGLTAITGSFEATNDWLDSSNNPCTEALPILCACRSAPDPF